MSAYCEQRDAFRRATARCEPIRFELPEHIQEIWHRRFFRPVKQLARRGQYVNRFLVGADPEFWLTDTQDVRTDANAAGLKAGLAYGADNNGRLAELRPEPSRSSLEVVASCGSALRWMSWLTPLNDYHWKSGAYNGHDGIGGHIHFGRKRTAALRDEAMALDTLTYWLATAGVFDSAQMRERYQRSRHYGNLTDLRRQTHGYEYRTMPSWLDSPWLAFFVTTLAKLVVHDPSLVPVLDRYDERNLGQRAAEKLIGLLAYYQDRDDDAALAYAVYSKHGLPKFSPANFRPRWGLFAQPPKIDKVDVIPSSIQPTAEEVAELQEALLANRPPDPVGFEPSWHPYKLPVGWAYLPTVTQTYHAPGIGELVVGLAVPKDAPFQVVGNANVEATVCIANSWASLLPKGWVRIFQEQFSGIKFRQDGTKGVVFYAGIDWRVHTAGLREWLKEYFPVQEVASWNPQFWAEYQVRLQAAKDTKKPAPGKASVAIPIVE